MKILHFVVSKEEYTILAKCKLSKKPDGKAPKVEFDIKTIQQEIKKEKTIIKQLKKQLAEHPNGEACI